MPYADIDSLNAALVSALNRKGYEERYPSEIAFEQDVWKRVRAVIVGEVGETAADELCLTSHTAITPRSQTAWDRFMKEPTGPDVDVLDSDNRLDIVVKHPRNTHQTIGIEIKLLGKSDNAIKLTQGIGQAILALANRSRTILVIHGGEAGREQCRQLQGVVERICSEPHLSIIVVFE